MLDILFVFLDDDALVVRNIYIESFLCFMVKHIPNVSQEKYKELLSAYGKSVPYLSKFIMCFLPISQITETVGESFKVFLVDEGDSTTVAEIRRLPPELEVTEPLASECRLEAPPGGGGWTEEAQRKFAQILSEPGRQFKMTQISEGDVTVVDLLFDSASVRRTLIDTLNL